MAVTATPKKGLEDIIAGQTSICFIDGTEGRLVYRGYNIHDLVKGSFEETSYLLLYGVLPTESQLKDFTIGLKKELTLPIEVINFIKTLPKDEHPMASLRSAVSFLGHFDSASEDNSHPSNIRKSISLIAKTSMIVAYINSSRNGGEFTAPNPDFSFAKNFLWMVYGSEPNDRDVNIMDTALILHADHEFNASTFTARVIAATLSDMYSAVTGAIGALKGPLHGGANEQVMKMLLEVGTVDNAKAWITDALINKKKIMGFGHRVYKTEDPRATHLRKMSKDIGIEEGQTQWYQISEIIEQFILEQKGLYPNVDFYSASTYYVMGIPFDLYTPIFAASRIAGWCAHVIEQHDDNRLIRPAGDYIGKTNETYVDIANR
ncbi:MAG: citrate synthase [Chlorobiota bacterium]|jgi:citrate synthase|nr:citrate synthase [Chlorobiota bacterium]QQS66126.1 MAG: citrate synthase [Chlorobiota bacterium]